MEVDDDAAIMQISVSIVQQHNEADQRGSAPAAADPSYDDHLGAHSGTCERGKQDRPVS